MAGKVTSKPFIWPSFDEEPQVLLHSVVENMETWVSGFKSGLQITVLNSQNSYTRYGEK